MLPGILWLMGGVVAVAAAIQPQSVIDAQIVGGHGLKKRGDKLECGSLILWNTKTRIKFSIRSDLSIGDTESAVWSLTPPTAGWFENDIQTGATVTFVQADDFFSREEDDVIVHVRRDTKIDSFVFTIVALGADEKHADHVYDKSEGRRFEYYETGAIKREVIYRDGRIHGVDIGYYENAKPKYIGKYVHGRKNGEFISFHRNGQPGTRAHYSNDLLHGSYVMYDETGVVLTEMQFKDDKLDGIVSHYYPSGTLKDRAFCKNGMRNGLEQLYFEDGRLEREATYADDEFDGDVKMYDGQGILNEIHKYDKGSPLTFTTLDPGGIVRERRTYIKGRKEDYLLERFDAVGNRISRKSFVDYKEASSVEDN